MSSSSLTFYFSRWLLIRVQSVFGEASFFSFYRSNQIFGMGWNIGLAFTSRTQDRKVKWSGNEVFSFFSHNENPNRETRSFVQLAASNPPAPFSLPCDTSHGPGEEPECHFAPSFSPLSSLSQVKVICSKDKKANFLHFFKVNLHFVSELMFRHIKVEIGHVTSTWLQPQGSCYLQQQCWIFRVW